MKKFILCGLIFWSLSSYAQDMICQGDLGPASYAVQIGTLQGTHQFAQITGYLKNGTTPPQILGSFPVGGTWLRPGPSFVGQEFSMQVLSTGPDIVAGHGSLTAKLSNGNPLALNVVCYSTASAPLAQNAHPFLGCRPCGSMDGGCICKRW